MPENCVVSDWTTIHTDSNTFTDKFTVVISEFKLGDVELIIIGTTESNVPEAILPGISRATEIIESLFISSKKESPVRNPPFQPSGSVPMVSEIESGTFPEFCIEIWEIADLPRAKLKPS